MISSALAGGQNISDVQCRCSHAVKLMEGRRHLNRKEAACEAGVVYGTLCRYIRGEKTGNRGRRPKCSLEGQKIVSEQVQSSTKPLDMSEVRVLYQKRILIENGFNTYADLETFAKLCPKTVKRYMESAGMMQNVG